MDATIGTFSATAGKEFVSVDEQTTRKSLIIQFYQWKEGLKRAEAKQDLFQQKEIAVCVDECEEYEHSALPRAKSELATASERCGNRDIPNELVS